MEFKPRRPASTSIFFAQLQYFDQLLKTVKNKTTVWYKFSKSFYKHQFDHWFLYFMQKCITIFRWKNFVSQYRNISWRNPSVLCFRKFSVAKKFMAKRGGGVSRFSVQYLLSHSFETIRRRTFLRCVSESFW